MSKRGETMSATAIVFLAVAVFLGASGVAALVAAGKPLKSRGEDWSPRRGRGPADPRCGDRATRLDDRPIGTETRRRLASASMNHVAEAGERPTRVRSTPSRPMDVWLTLPTFGSGRRPRRTGHRPNQPNVVGLRGPRLTRGRPAPIISGGRSQETNERDRDNVVLVKSHPDGGSAWIGCGFGSATRRSSRRSVPINSATTWGTSASPSWPGSSSGSRGVCSCAPTSWPSPNYGSTGSCGGACSSRCWSSASRSRSRPSSAGSGNGSRSSSRRRRSSRGSTTPRTSRRCPRSTGTSASS